MASEQRPPRPRRAAVVGARWEGGGQAVFHGLRDWRALHPRATLAEIEAELDRQLGRLRAQMLADLALASAAADLATSTPGERPVCPDCGGALRDEGGRERTLLTLGDEAVTLRRDYATCAACDRRLFPPGR
jgi:hypothetical protein